MGSTFSFFLVCVFVFKQQVFPSLLFVDRLWILFHGVAVFLSEPVCTSDVYFSINRNNYWITKICLSHLHTSHCTASCWRYIILFLFRLHFISNPMISRGLCMKWQISIKRVQDFSLQKRQSSLRVWNNNQRAPRIALSPQTVVPTVLVTHTYVLFPVGLLPPPRVYSTLFSSLSSSSMFSSTVPYETLHFILNSYNFNVAHKNILICTRENTVILVLLQRTEETKSNLRALNINCCEKSQTCRHFQSISRAKAEHVLVVGSCEAPLRAVEGTHRTR